MADGSSDGIGVSAPKAGGTVSGGSWFAISSLFP